MIFLFHQAATLGYSRLTNLIDVEAIGAAVGAGGVVVHLGT